MSQRISDPVGWLMDEVRINGIGQVFGVYPGIYRAVVISNSDPENRGRVKVLCPSIGQRSEDHVLENMWALPVSSGLSAPMGADSQMRGFFFPPEENDLVWVMFEGGAPSEPRYIGGWLRAEDEDDIQSEYMDGVDMRSGADSPVTKRGIRTSTGHSLVFDDDSKSIVISRGDEGKHPGDVIIVQESQIVISTANGDTITVGDGTVSIVAGDSSMMAIGDDSFSLTNKSGTTVSAKGEGISMTASGDINIVAGGGINLNSGSVQLGKGPVFESAVTGDTFATLFAAHIHTSALPGVPTSPTVVPPVVPMNGLAMGVKISKT